VTTRKSPHDPRDPRTPEGREGAEAPPAPLDSHSVNEKVAELESGLAETKDRYLRLAADFDNYKKRSRQEHLETIQHASGELIGRLLPALDDLHNALEHQPDGVDETWARGLQLAVRKLEDALRAHGLEPISAVGEHFDPKLHEAIGHEDTDEHPEDTVVSELRRGYRVRDRVVRPSLVRVARPQAHSAAADDRATE
jgi:molecular chaperone GrpE